MNVVRVTGTLQRPWNLVEDELCNIFSDPSIQDTRYTWEVVIAQIFYVTLTADKVTGEVEIILRTSFPYLSSSIIAIVSTIFIVVFYQTPVLLFLTMAACLLLVFFITIPANVIFNRYVYRPTSNFFFIEQYRFSRLILIPFAGWLIAFVAIQWTSSLLLPALILACLLVGLVAYISAISMTPLRRQVLLGALSLLTTLPLISSVGNLVFVSLWSEQVTGGAFIVAISVIAVGTIITIAVLIRICQILSYYSQQIGNRAIDSVVHRIAWGGVILGLNISSFMLFPIYFFGEYLGGSDVSTTLVTEFSNAGFPVPELFAWVVLIILISPFLSICILWVFHLYNQIRMRRLLSKTIKPVDIGVDDPVHLWETESAQAYAHTTLVGEDKIVITSGLRDSLEPEELQAVIKHEKYHLKHRSPIRIVLVTVLGLLFGGRNIIVVLFDFPGIEKRADRYAVEQIGTAPMVQALRRLEQVRSSGPMTQPSFLAGPPFISQTNQHLSDRLISPPYYVLFGSIVSESAHPSIDNRITFILNETD